MNPIDAINGLANPAATLSAPSNQMGKEEFLRLLVAQLSNQDPLQPLEAQEFAAQLAQFTSVEQLLNIQHTLEDGLQMYGLMAQSLNSSVAAGLVGREVEMATGRIELGAEGSIDLGFSLESAAEKVRITVLDADGTPVRTLSAGSRASGTHFVEWDGTSDDGDRLPPGAYTFKISAEGDDAFSAPGLIRGRVDRVSFGQGGIQLWVNGVSYSMNAVVSVTE